MAYFSFALSKIRRELNKGGWENSIWWPLQIFKSKFKPETKLKLKLTLCFIDTCTMNIRIFAIQQRSCDWLLYISLFVYSSCDVWCLLIVFNCNKRLKISTFVYFANTFALKAVSNTDYLCILAVLQGDFNCSFPKSSKRQKSEATLFGACMPLNNLHIRKSPSLARQIDRHKVQFSGNFQIKFQCLLQTSFKFDWQPFRF